MLGKLSVPGRPAVWIIVGQGPIALAKCAGGGLFGHFYSPLSRGGWVVRRCWVNFLCRGVLPIWIRVGQGPIVLAKGAGGGCLDIVSLVYHFSFLSPSLGDGPGRVAQSEGHPTHKSGVLGSIPGLATYFRFSFRFFKKGSCQLLAKVCARSTG